jgi:ComF family protein
VRAAFRRLLSSWSKYAEVLLYPSFCEVCQAFLEKPGESILCLSCQEKIKPRPWDSYCLCCGRFFEGAGEPHLCLGCLEKTPPFSKHRSCGRYEGIIKDVILLYKYRGFEGLGRYLAGYVEQALGSEEDLWLDVDAIVPVPLHRVREKERGFNQSRVLAKKLSRIKKIQLLDRRLVKVKNIPPQTSLEAKERVRNVRGAFRVKRPGAIKGKVILLVDDVYTTGSTLSECSLALKDAGAKEVRAVTIAQA